MPEQGVHGDNHADQARRYEREKTVPQHTRAPRESQRCRKVAATWVPTGALLVDVTPEGLAVGALWLLLGLAGLVGGGHQGEDDVERYAAEEGEAVDVAEVDFAGEEEEEAVEKEEEDGTGEVGVVH